MGVIIMELSIDEIKAKMKSEIEAKGGIKKFINFARENNLIQLETGSSYTQPQTKNHT
jgi:hypothetical protein